MGAGRGGSTAWPGCSWVTLTQEGMNSELGVGRVDPVLDTVENLLIPGCGSPGRCFTFAGWEGAEGETPKF